MRIIRETLKVYDHSYVGKCVVQHMTIFTHDSKDYCLITETWNKLGYRYGYHEHKALLNRIAGSLPIIPEDLCTKELAWGETLIYSANYTAVKQD